MNNSVDNPDTGILKFALPQNGRLKMNLNVKNAIQTELLHRLKAAWVLAETDVECKTGRGVFLLDVALHTGSFIYGHISINGGPSHKSAMAKFGIETKHCTTIEDIEDCIAWATARQEEHCLSQAVQMVA